MAETKIEVDKDFLLKILQKQDEMAKEIAFLHKAQERHAVALSKTMGDNKSNVLVSIMIEKAGMDIIS